jgi:DNA-binding response OmpR family regulator
MKRVLLIEDDPDLYELLKYNLEKAGFQFAGAKPVMAQSICVLENVLLAALKLTGLPAWNWAQTSIWSSHSRSESLSLA